ncbi:hypothetical protein HW511_06395 [Asaia siamensis]|uniref:Uncharacterized protein n=1 Tax=Asaia siamensis TaxID=110479 RepID=A0ABQ1LQ91_9PROT|nr:hypothetical protein [Asaia siamensis]GGC26403.1 hypothetical protein GCM10007207_09780 [Asaia siamensis]
MLAAPSSNPGGQRHSPFSMFMHNRQNRPYDVWLVSLFAVHVIIFAFVVWGTAMTTPYLDMLTWQHEALEALRVNDGANWLHHFLLPHNEHRIAFERALTLVDLEIGGGHQIAFIAASLLSVLIIAGLLWRILSEGASNRERLLALLVPMLILSSTSALDIGVPINCVYPISLVFSVAAIVLFARAVTAQQNVTPLFAGAMLCALLSPFSNMTGLGIWPVLLWLGWQAKAKQSILAVILSLAVIETSLYLWHDSTAPAVHSGAHGIAALERMIAYAGIFLGLPFSRLAALALPAMVFGLCLGLVALAVLVNDCLRRKTATRASLVSTGLILIGLGVALMASLGRLNENVELIAPARYALYVVLLHAGLIMRALVWLRSRPCCVGQADLKTATGFALLLVLFQMASGLAGVRAASDLRAVVLSWQPGMQDARYVKLIFPELSYAVKVHQEVEDFLSTR